MPERAQLDTRAGTTLFMLAAVRAIEDDEDEGGGGGGGGRECLGIKIVSVVPQNERLHGLPTVPAFSVVMDPQRGIPRALMDASVLTGVRTAAGSAISLRLCWSGSHEDGVDQVEDRQGIAEDDRCRRMVVFGARTQAFWHILLCVHVLRGELDEVVICNRSHSRAEGLARRLVDGVMRSRDFQFEMSRGESSEAKRSDTGSPPTVQIRVTDMRRPDAANEEVARAKIICTCTNASTPLFDGSQIRPGTHHVRRIVQAQHAGG